MLSCFDGPPDIFEEESLPEEALVVDQVPEDDGGSRVRILCATQPLAQVRPAGPTLEDGYLQLVGYRVGKSNETA